jgi:hypothetical protein
MFEKWLKIQGFTANFLSFLPFFLHSMDTDSWMSLATFPHSHQANIDVCCSTIQTSTWQSDCKSGHSNQKLTKTRITWVTAK